MEVIYVVLSLAEDYYFIVRDMAIQTLENPSNTKILDMKIS